MGDHNKQFCLLVLIMGIFFSCSWEKTEPDERSQPSPDTTQTTDFYFFIPAADFLDSGYDILAMFEERDDIPVLPVDDSFGERIQNWVLNFKVDLFNAFI